MVTIDTTKARCDEVFRQGEQFTRAVTYYDATGALVTTISSARFAVWSGTLASPTGVLSTVTVPVTVTAGTTMTYTLTAAQTRLILPGSNYCYVLEATLADGSIHTILQGEIQSAAEIA